MGTWISHLRIAENLLAHFPGTGRGHFCFWKSFTRFRDPERGLDRV
jgi:hypothetical protein